MYNVHAIHVRKRPYSGTGEVFANVFTVRDFLQERTQPTTKRENVRWVCASTADAAHSRTVDRIS